MIKSRDTIVRLKQFQMEEKKRRVMQIEAMIAEFNRMMGDLDREIENEEKRSGITDQNHFAYPTFARAARVRRENLQNSANELSTQLSEAKEQLEEAQEDVRRSEALEMREKNHDSRYQGRPNSYNYIRI